MSDLRSERYLVIADYPNSPFVVGDILIKDEKRQYGFWVNEQFYTDRNPKQYPAIFRKLEWWEHREESEMPNALWWPHADKDAISDKLYEDMLLLQEKRNNAKEILADYHTQPKEQPYVNPLAAMKKEITEAGFTEDDFPKEQVADEDIVSILDWILQNSYNTITGIWKANGDSNNYSSADILNKAKSALKLSLRTPVSDDSAAWDHIESYFREIFSDLPFKERVDLRIEMKSKLSVTFKGYKANPLHNEGWKKQLIQKIKEQWIEDFGDLGTDIQGSPPNGYLIAGFVEAVLQKFTPINK